MAKAKILKTPDPKPHIPTQKERRDGSFLMPEEREETIPISRGEFQRLQQAWFAIEDLASLLKETSCEQATNPCSVLLILTGELGKVVTKLEAKFEKAERGEA